MAKIMMDRGLASSRGLNNLADCVREKVCHANILPAPSPYQQMPPTQTHHITELGLLWTPKWETRKFENQSARHTRLEIEANLHPFATLKYLSHNTSMNTSGPQSTVMQ